jgi:putative Holliday junction resolvase
VRVLAIDYGRRRIGLALSDPTGLLARPWKAMVRSGNVAQVAAALARDAETLRTEDDGLEAVVVGYPRHLDGGTHALTDAAVRLADRLRRLLPVPVVLQDERLTSREADAQLAAHERDWRKRRALVDAAAAALILQDYLDGRARAALPPAVGAGGDHA